MLVYANSKKGDLFMPLTMADYGKEMKIIKVAGQEETRRHLENLGFVEGAAVTVINSLGGSLIINIKNSRIAISKGAANKIMV